MPERQRMGMEPMEVRLKGYAAVEKVATRQGGTAHVTVPVAWLGKRVKAILVEPIEGE